jgi:GT2 family glycosyltransferase
MLDRLNDSPEGATAWLNRMRRWLIDSWTEPLIGLWRDGMPHVQPTCFGVLAAETLGCLSDIKRTHGPALTRIFEGVERDADGLPLMAELRRPELSSHSATYIRLQTQYFLLHASDALGLSPAIPLGFLEKLSDRGYLFGWMDGGPWDNPWLHSNNIMFALTFLQFWWSATGTHLAIQRIDDVLDYLDQRQDSGSGLWQPNNGTDMYNAMYAAYHFWPYYFWRGRRPRHVEAVIDATLGLQRPDGLFGRSGSGGGACEDLDAIHTLVMMSLVADHRAAEVESALARALESLLAAQNDDGGFSNYFVHTQPKSLRRRASEAVGLDRLLKRRMKAREWRQSGWTQLSCPVTRSDMWAAWFRPLAIRLILHRYGVGPQGSEAGAFRRKPGLGWHDTQQIRASQLTRAATNVAVTAHPTAVSAVIPCYNAAAWLRTAIESVLTQSRPVAEVIVVDDCSTDASCSIASEYPIRLLKTGANRGHASARNLALQAASHDLVAWLDADDYWDRHHCAVVVSLLDEHSDAAVAFSAMRLVEGRTGVWKMPTACVGPTCVVWECFNATIVPASSAITRRQAVLDVGGFREELRIAPDFDLWLRMALRYPFVWTQQATSNYRWHEQQISRDPLAQLRSTYRSRVLIMQNAKEAGDVELADLMRNRTRDLVDRDLVAAWWRADIQCVRLLLGVAMAEGLDTPASRRLRRFSKIPARWVKTWRTAQSLIAGG